MSRTPLMRILRRAMKIAAHSNRKNTPPVDELIGISQETRADWTRRKFLKTSTAAGIFLAGGGIFSACGKTEPPSSPAPTSSGPKVVIVGAGVAGLNAAWKLKSAGLSAQIFEAAGRTGGRIFTGQDLMGPGLTTELGGEFIDTEHEEMLSLAKEFNLELVDTQVESELKLTQDAFFFEGRHYSDAQLIRAVKPICARIAEDYDALGEVVNFEIDGGGTALDQMSISEYFDKIGVRGWLRKLFEVAYVTEYGLEAGEQSALNFIFMIPTEVEDTFSMFGDSDERYKIRGGNQRIVDELAKKVQDQIRMKHRLEAVRSRGTGYTLTFQDDGGKSVDVDADMALIAIPFTLLRDVKMDLELPKWKTKAIAELGYGNCAKVMVGYKKRFWRDLGFIGSIYSDEPFQLAWDNSQLQPGEAGGMTYYSGGLPATQVGNQTAEYQAERLTPGIEKAYKGALAHRSDKVSRFHWPTHPFSKGAYAAYKPGQWTTIAGAEGRAVGNLFFAGEHTSYDFQGYMNGGAQSGKDAAEAIIGAISGKPVAPAAAASQSVADTK